jgi:hypothetical protein
MMRQLFHLLPASSRLYLRVWQRRCADLVSGQHRQLATLKPNLTNLPVAINLQQVITGGDAAANKIQNIQIAIDCLQGIILLPGQQ